jgi:hypothetical protein
LHGKVFRKTTWLCLEYPNLWYQVFCIVNV